VRGVPKVGFEVPQIDQCHACSMVRYCSNRNRGRKYLAPSCCLFLLG
jgi:uncharacterized protein (UPF0179 family)